MGVRLNNCIKVIQYLEAASDTERSLSDIQFATRVSYSSVARVVKEYFPECFHEVEGIGWFITGVHPLGLSEMPKLPEPPSQPKSMRRVVDFADDEKPKPLSTGKWQWSQPAISWLDNAKVRWPDKTLKELLDGSDTKQLNEMEIVAKTWLHAIQEKRRTGGNSF